MSRFGARRLRYRATRSAQHRHTSSPVSGERASDVLPEPSRCSALRTAFLRLRPTCSLPSTRQQSRARPEREIRQSRRTSKVEPTRRVPCSRIRSRRITTSSSSSDDSGLGRERYNLTSSPVPTVFEGVTRDAAGPRGSRVPAPAPARRSDAPEARRATAPRIAYRKVAPRARRRVDCSAFSLAPRIRSLASAQPHGLHARET